MTSFDGVERDAEPHNQHRSSKPARLSGMVEADYPDEIVRIREPVDIRFAIHLDHVRARACRRSPVVLFEKIGNAGMPVVTNMAGNRKLLAACLGVAPNELPTAFRERVPEIRPLRGREGRCVERSGYRRR